MVTELENIEEFLIEQSCELSNLTRSWKVKDKRYREGILEVKTEYLELRDSVIQLIDFQESYEAVVKSIKLGEKEYVQAQEIIEEFRSHKLKEKFDSIELIRENKEDKQLKEILKAHQQALELREVSSEQRNQIYEAQNLVKAVIDQELEANLTESFKLELESGEEIETEEFKFETSEDSKEAKALKEKL